MWFDSKAEFRWWWWWLGLWAPSQSALFLIQRRWMVDSDGARPDDDEYDRLDYIRSVLDDQQCAHRSTIGLQDISNEGTRSEELWLIFSKMHFKYIDLCS